MKEFIAEYWLSFAFGAIIAGITFFFKRFLVMFQEKQEREQNDFYNKLHEEILGKRKESQAEHIQARSQVEEEIAKIKEGLLSVQGKMFREQCYILLDKDHNIEVEEYKQFEKDYNSYKLLGGNHLGDMLHDRVVTKFDNENISE